MRIVSRLLLLVGAIISLGFLTSGSGSAAGKGGLTLTPATMTLELASGESEQSSSFTVTNQYDTALSLSFSFESKEGSSGKTQPAGYLGISNQTITLGAGESSKQTVTLTDNGRLGPGSQLADLVVSQSGIPGADIGVLPSIRMPLAIVKLDGAVSAVSLSQFSSSHFGFILLSTLSATLHNSGNMTAIPRGVIKVIAPGGSVVRQGAINTSSFAVAPGDDISLATPLNKLDGAFWPGVYRTSVSYGLGSGQADKTAYGWFFYVAWWHLAALAALAAAGYLGVRYVPRRQRKLPPAHHPPKRAVLIGRDIT